MPGAVACGLGPFEQEPLALLDSLSLCGCWDPASADARAELQEGLLLVGRGRAEAHGGRAKGGDAVVIGDLARFGGETGSHRDRRRVVRFTVRPGGQRTRYCSSKYPILQ